MDSRAGNDIFLIKWRLTQLCHGGFWFIWGKTLSWDRQLQQISAISAKPMGLCWTTRLQIWMWLEKKKKKKIQIMLHTHTHIFNLAAQKIYASATTSRWTPEIRVRSSACGPKWNMVRCCPRVSYGALPPPRGSNHMYRFSTAMIHDIVRSTLLLTALSSKVLQLKLLQISLKLTSGQWFVLQPGARSVNITLGEDPLWLVQEVHESGGTVLKCRPGEWRSLHRLEDCALTGKWPPQRAMIDWGFSFCGSDYSHEDMDYIVWTQAVKQQEALY